jgi:hypothetical protein
MPTKWLTIKEDVKLTDAIEQVIYKLENFFEIQNRRAVVTSGFRDPVDQLGIIYRQAHKQFISPTWTPRDVDVKDGRGYYVWQETWSRLLGSGYIVNPPRPAVVLERYINSKGVDMTGKVIGSSPHFLGKSFDIADASNISVIQYALTHKPDIGIRSYLVERGNGTQGCVHIDVV